MSQEIQNALSSPMVAKAVLSSNAFNVLLATLEVYSIIASAIILTISGVLTYYMMKKQRAESILLDIEVERSHRRRENDE